MAKVSPCTAPRPTIPPSILYHDDIGTGVQWLLMYAGDTGDFRHTLALTAHFLLPRPREGILRALQPSRRGNNAKLRSLYGVFEMLSTQPADGGGKKE